MTQSRYRPELILKARYFAGTVNLDKPWYEGVALNDQIRQQISQIDKVLDS